MRTYTILLAVALTAGCAQRSTPDPRLEELEKRLTEIEIRRVSELESLRAIIEENRAMVSEITNLFPDLRGVVTAEVKNEVALQISRQIEALKIEAPINAQRRAAATGPAAPIRTAFKNGVPIAVYDQIAADAQRQWPSDFQMQEWTIKNQIAAWQKLNAR